MEKPEGPGEEYSELNQDIGIVSNLYNWIFARGLSVWLCRYGYGFAIFAPAPTGCISLIRWQPVCAVGEMTFATLITQTV